VEPVFCDLEPHFGTIGLVVLAAYSPGPL
jgi:hypothetical protein